MDKATRNNTQEEFLPQNTVTPRLWLQRWILVNSPPSARVWLNRRNGLLTLLTMQRWQTPRSIIGHDRHYITWRTQSWKCRIKSPWSIDCLGIPGRVVISKTSSFRWSWPHRSHFNPRDVGKPVHIFVRWWNRDRIMKIRQKGHLGWWIKKFLLSKSSMKDKLVSPRLRPRACWTQSVS
jgi:hypothetical protein